MAAATTNRIKSALENTGYEQLVKDSSEKLAECVEEYPISTVLTALSGGIIIGAVATLLLIPRARRRR